MKWFAAVAFGLEGITAGELRRLGLDGVQTENGRVSFECAPRDALRTLTCVRTADRVYLEAGRYPALTFDELFEGCAAIPWEELVPMRARIPVRGHASRSRLMSVSDCQAILKRAIVERFTRKKGVTRLPEDGPECAVEFILQNDRVVIGIDAAGDALNKRGYRLKNHAAPLKETLAAGLLLASPWRPGEPFWDPMCGSGTLAIEAALIASGRAPGMSRRFALEGWPMLTPSDASAVREEIASAARAPSAPIFAGDISPEALALAREHAANAGVSGDIVFSLADARDAAPPEPSGAIVVNPPYGERLGTRDEAADAARALRALMDRALGWSLTALTADASFERAFGRKADKRPRFYNGRLECQALIYSKKRSDPHV